MRKQRGNDVNVMGVTSRPEGSRRGNRRMPLSEFQFPEIHLRTRKVYDILARLKTGLLHLQIN